MGKFYNKNERSFRNPIEYDGFRTGALSQAWLLLKLVRTPLNVLLRGYFLYYLSFYAPITSDECHAWFHLNADSPAARNTEQVNLTKIVHGRIRTPTRHGLQLTSQPSQPLGHNSIYMNEGIKMSMKCVSIQSINKVEKVHVYRINNVVVVVHISLITYEYC